MIARLPAALSFRLAFATAGLAPGCARSDCFFDSAHLVRCAAAIRFRAATDIFRRLRFGVSAVAAGEFEARSIIALSFPNL